MKKIRKRRRPKDVPQYASDDDIEFMEAVMYMFGHELAFWNRRSNTWEICVGRARSEEMPHSCLLPFGLLIGAGRLENGDWICELSWSPMSGRERHWVFDDGIDPEFHLGMSSGCFGTALLRGCELIAAKIVEAGRGAECETASRLESAIKRVHILQTSSGGETMH